MNVLVLGALSPVGRDLIRELVRGDIGNIRAADYSLPVLAYLNKDYSQCFDKVDYVQANLRSKEGMEKAFINARYDCVFNCTTTLKADMVEQFCKERLLDTAVHAATETLRTGSGVLLHVSTACCYK